jgi:hypothetical protein
MGGLGALQPSDPEPDALRSISAWLKAAQVTNVRAPIVLDASESPWPIASADGIICLHQHGPHLTLGCECRLDQGCGRDTSSRVTALSLWPSQTQRGRNRPEQRSVRPEPSRSQPYLGSARSGGGRCDNAIRWILGSGCHRNARKQSERCVPLDVILNGRLPPAANGRFTLALRSRFMSSFRPRVGPQAQLGVKTPFPRQTLLVAKYEEPAAHVHAL